MNLVEAMESARQGNFVTNEYFDSEQSMHFYNGKFYYEDGPVVTYAFLRCEDFAIHGEWRVKYTPDQINQDKLKQMHEDNMILYRRGLSYEDCINKESSDTNHIKEYRELIITEGESAAPYSKI